MSIFMGRTFEKFGLGNGIKSIKVNQTKFKRFQMKVVYNIHDDISQIFLRISISTKFSAISPMVP